MSSTKKFSPHTLFTSGAEGNQHFRLFLDDLIHDGAQIHEILNALHNANDGDTLEIRINSGGGIVKYGQQLINVIRGRFYEHCVTVIESDACSMAALIFMAGDRRMVYEHSVLMVHDISMYLVGKASESKKQLEAEVYVFKNKFKGLFEDFLSDEEIEDIFEGRDQWFNCLEMCERGIATHVMTQNGDMLTAEEYLDQVKNPDECRLKELKENIAQYKEILKELEKKWDEFDEKLEAAKVEYDKLNENSDSRQATEQHKLPETLSFTPGGGS